ncbi:unnamed protein product [marine sediment metagenome]|uniref:Uncharacterized protein n=1 Tax=marine sediment metagenome TaxID=412755 RepID=X0WIC4_9ZZZZ
MSLLDNAIKHFSESADTELHKIDIPEWDGAIWFKSVAGMNGAMYQRYFKAIQNTDFESLVDVVILRSREEAGVKMFKPNDKKALMAQVSPDVITSIINKMSAVDAEVQEEVKKS